MTSSFALSIILFLSFSVTVEFMQHTLTPLQPWTADLSIISPDNACAIDKALLDDLKENPVVDLAYGRNLHTRFRLSQTVLKKDGFNLL